MLILWLLLHVGIHAVLSSVLTHNTGLENCVYTFNVPRSQSMCPPGAVEGAPDDLKRLMENQHSELTEQLRNLTRMITELSTSQQDGNEGNGEDQEPGFKSGTHYTRWGHAGCPPTADLLYTGYAAKARYNEGGGVDFQCLPTDPDLPPGGSTGHESKSYIYGVEYEKQSSPLVPESKHNNDVPCAVCHVNNRGEEIMIPAKVTCPVGWTKEYEGLLMAQHYTQHGSTYVCADKDMQTLPGGSAGQDGGLFYVVETQCGPLPCPPYRHGFECVCVVCTL